MKTLLPCLAICLALPLSVFSQNKSLGVGTTTPNPNAALHVESPTNNQGIIIPRLSTAQRTGITPTLVAGDIGLIIFDTDLRALAIWNGSGWDLGSKVGAPINIANNAATGSAAVLENSNAGNANPALVVNTSGSGSAITTNAPIVSQHTGPSVSSGVFINQNAANPNAALYTQTAGTGPVVSALSLGSNSAAIFEVNNAANASSVMNVSTNGTGAAANLSITNGASTSPILTLNTTGSGNAITANAPIQASAFVGDGSGLTNLPPVSFPLSTAQATTLPLLDLTNTGTGVAASFTINNAGNTASALAVTTAGTGFAGEFRTTNTAHNTATLGAESNSNTAGSAAIGGRMIGTGGPAGYFQINNAANNYAAVTGLTNGTNGGGYFQNTNATNAFSTLSSLTNGTGPAGYFQNTNAANTSSTVYGVTNGSGNAIAIRGDITNAANTAAAVYGSTVGSGVGLYGISTGTGAAIQGYTTTAPTAIYGQRDGATNGNAGVFSITNAANTSSSLIGTTTGAGPAGSFQINNTGNNSPVLTANTNGNGSAATFTITQGTNTAPALNISHAGTGNAITANRPIQATQFIGDGSLLTGISGFSLPYTNSANDVGSLFSLTNSSTGTGSGAVFETTSGTNTGNSLTANSASGGGGLALSVNASGVSTAMRINATNAGNTQPALNIVHAGTGNAITANRPIQATTLTATGNVNANGLNYTWPGAQASGVLTNNGSGGLTWAAASGLTLPYSNSVSSGSIAFDVANTGTGTTLYSSQQGTSGSAGIFNITNVSNSSPALQVGSGGTGVVLTSTSNGIAGQAGLFSISNVTNASASIQASTGGTGSAAQLTVTNAGNNSAALNISHSGTGNAITANRPIQATQFIGDGSLLTGLPGLTLPYTNSVANAGALFSLTNTGTGRVSNLVINNAGSAQNAIYAETNGTGRAADIRVTNASSTAEALAAITSGTGSAFTAINQGTAGAAARLDINNAGNTSPALFIQHNGTGNAITANRPIQATQFIGDGSLLTGISGGFNLPYTNTMSSASPLFELTNSNGTTATFWNSGSGAAAEFRSTSGTSPVVYGLSETSREVALFQATSPISTFPAVEIESYGNAPALLVNKENNNGAAQFNTLSGSNNTPTVQITNTGLAAALSATADGDGSPASFTINNNFNTNQIASFSSNGTGRGVQINLTDAGNTQAAIEINHAGTGNAITANAPIQATDFNAPSGTGSFYSISTGAGGASIGGDVTASAFYGDGSGLTNLPSGLSLPYSSTQPGASPLFQITNSTDGGAASFQTNGTGGSAGVFSNTNSLNGSAAVSVSSAGSLSLDVSGASTLYAGSTTAITLTADNSYGGQAANFYSGGGSDPTVYIYNDGTGPGIRSLSPLDIPSNSTTTPALSIATGTIAVPAMVVDQSGTGAALQGNHSANGLALLLQAGGLRIPTATLAGGGVITTRAIAYRLNAPSAPTNYTFPGGYLQEGDTFFFYNDGPNTAQIDGNSIPVNTGVIMVYIGGQIRFYGN